MKRAEVNRTLCSQEELRMLRILDQSTNVYEKFTVKTLEEARKTSGILLPIAKWRAEILESSYDDQYDVFFIRSPKTECQDNVARCIKKAQEAFVAHEYEACIKGAESFLERANCPDFEVYAMLGYAYKFYAEKRRRIDSAKKSLDEEFYEMLNTKGQDYLRLYNHFKGRQTNIINGSQVVEELNAWMSKERPEKNNAEGISKKGIKNLFVPCIGDVNELIRTGQARTIEEAGLQLKLSRELIDLTKLAYARYAFKSQLPNFAERYLKSVEKTSDKSDTVKAVLASIKKDQALKNEHQPLPLVKSPNGEEHMLILAPPGNRKTA